jgi:glutamate--cysteine ligase
MIKARSMRRGIWSRTGHGDVSGNNETGYLGVLQEVVSRGQTPAESLLERYQGAWGGDLTRVYAEESF